MERQQERGGSRRRAAKVRYTIDASVFVSAGSVAEARHRDAFQFLRWTVATGTVLYCPTLVLAECAAAISRQTGKAALAQRVVRLIARLPNVVLVPLDLIRAHRAADIAMAHRLRGADAVYVAVASDFNATLVTHDTEMLQRASRCVTAISTPKA
jgi:predicted nucleic acid-binding protein